MIVIFSHGKSTGPFIRKYEWIKEVTEDLGLLLEAVDYRGTQNPDQRVELLLAKLDTITDEVFLVGNSMGGYVSAIAAACREIRGDHLLLLAPAFYMPGYRRQEYIPGARIIHGTKDSVIPYLNSVRYSASSILVDDDHSLLNSQEIIQRVLREQLTTVQVAC